MSAEALSAAGWQAGGPDGSEKFDASIVYCLAVLGHSNGLVLQRQQMLGDKPQ